MKSGTIELRATIIGLYTGRPRQHWPGKPVSAIVKHLARTTQELGPTGFANDEQADLSVHGGLEKAVHHYAAEHYADWRSELGQDAQDFGPGRFGENIATLGLTEAGLCIGDRLTLGSAVVEISQGRQPCWKLNAHTGVATMAKLFQETARTGWYYRVITPGSVSIGDEIRRLECPNPGWTVERVTRARLNPQLDPGLAATLARLPRLAPGWAAAFRRKAGPEYREDVTARLDGPA
ncbi:MOSC domain-containing protein [Hoeflea sp. YIM 152468]|uniref:MOSC domain-containing protein n=1 Tax=Hoeflea sp. YIM 152468 TaxID=3031759 RepID=UPI0023DAF60C|nr:MOSC domain-containing protein [Hoeflea sp. YIM 152468]MDF1606807.1 MOSC domain-containing protein [Hoeflea sp. YIM 152468]